MTPRPLYFVRRAIEAMARGPRVTVVATLTVYVAVLVTGVFLAALHGAHELVSSWGRDVRISVYLDPTADVEAARAAAQAVAPGRRVEGVAGEEALRRFRTSLGSDGALVDGLPPDVLPPSIEVEARGLRVDDVRALAARLHAIPGAQEVDWGAAWLEPLDRALRRARWVGLALLVALGGGAAVLVSNTLRLGVFARRDEIDIMRLVGATDGFVEAPFLIEGFLQGALGGILAAVTLLVGIAVALPRVSGILGAADLRVAQVLPPIRLVALGAAGAALGFVASALAVVRELRAAR